MSSDPEADVGYQPSATPEDFEGVEEKIEVIGAAWGAVYITYYPGTDAPWLLSNTTDEGLPVNAIERNVRDETLEAVADAALEKVLNDY